MLRSASSFDNLGGIRQVMLVDSSLYNMCSFVVAALIIHEDENSKLARACGFLFPWVYT